MVYEEETVGFVFEVEDSYKFRTPLGVSFSLEIHYPEVFWRSVKHFRGYLKLRKLNRCSLGHTVIFKLRVLGQPEKSVERELTFFRGTEILSLDIPKGIVNSLTKNSRSILAELTVRNSVVSGRPKPVHHMSQKELMDSSIVWSPPKPRKYRSNRLNKKHEVGAVDKLDCDTLDLTCFFNQELIKRPLYLIDESKEDSFEIAEQYFSQMRDM